MTLADLNAQIAARTAAAIREALDQLANGWTDTDVLEVAADSWAVIQDLKDQAGLLDRLRGALWDTACQHPSPMHPGLRCYVEAGHYPATGHLYTIDTRRAA